MGPLDTRVPMVDQCSRTTCCSSVDRVFEKGSRSGGPIVSSSVTKRRGVVFPHFDLFGNGGSLTSVHAVRATVTTTTTTTSTTTTATTCSPCVMIVPSPVRYTAFLTHGFRFLCVITRWHHCWRRYRVRVLT